MLMVRSDLDFQSRFHLSYTVEFTTLPRLIKGIPRALEHSGKCGRVTDRVAIKHRRACRSLPSQSAVNIPAAWR
ncbi:hypothetical protein ACTXT7_010627 [Hymenolepis weldensis]